MYRVFTYGTLMRGQIRHGVVENCRYLGDAILNDYGIKEVGSYPAAIPMKNYKVYGEVYEVDENTKAELDRIEGAGYLYDCKTVTVHSDLAGDIEALFYEYLQDTSNMKTKLPFGKWNEYRRDIDDYVWYASYGSNILRDRFLRYISKTSSEKIPLMERRFIFDHPIYFANNSGSRNWGTTGVAFLDMDRKGKTYGWMYLITKQQFDKINQLEGNSNNWYNDAPVVGHDELGIKIKTMTNKRKLNDVKPCNDYLDIIAAGLMERKLLLQLEAANEYLKTEELLDISEIHIKEILDRLV